MTGDSHGSPTTTDVGAEPAPKEAAERSARIEGEYEEFLYSVSHDLRAAFRGVSTLAGWLEQDHAGELGAEGRRLVELLDQRVRRTDRMLSDLLLYSRLGRLAVPAVDADLSLIVRKVIAELESDEACDIRVEGELPVIRCEPASIERLFHGLIENAVEHSRDRATVRVVVRCQDDGDVWRVEIEDDGPGIAEKDHERIFRPFEALDRAPDSDSIGMGLALARKLVETNGGRIGVRAVPGEGSTFFFTWPKTAAGDRMEV